jgi:hypothetical protein
LLFFIIYQVCGEIGHIAKECPIKRRRKDKNKKKKQKFEQQK